jgi:rubrerythrin
MSASLFDLDAYLSRSRAVDLHTIAWDQVPRHPLPQEAVRAMRYMQDIESHTIVYLRSLLDTRAIDDPEVATFLACWVYEETFHGIALARFVRCAGHEIELRPRSGATVRQTIERRLTSWLARVWPDFLAVHMTWGAVNELTTLTAYRRLATLVDHPVLRELLDRIVLDESRHFYFYFKQAERHLQQPAAARIARMVIERFWAPVGSGVQPLEETRFLADYLFGGHEGRAAARKVDATIADLPGFADVPLLDAWITRMEGDGGGRVIPAASRRGTPPSDAPSARARLFRSRRAPL